jgi:hypothetical protein
MPFLCWITEIQETGEGYEKLEEIKARGALDEMIAPKDDLLEFPGIKQRRNREGKEWKDSWRE